MRQTSSDQPADPSSDDRLALLLEVSDDGFWDHDLTTGVLWRSPVLIDLIGGVDDGRGDPAMPFGDHVHVDDRSMLETAIRAQLDGTRPLDIEFRLRTRWGAFRWVRARACVRCDPDGRPLRMVGALQNVSEIRRIRRDLRDATMGLERARDEAAAANRTKSDFLANVSHEIRTPLNGIVGMVRLLQGTRLTEDQRRYTDSLHGSATLLLALLNDILDLSRLEAGGIQLDIVEFALGPLVDDVLNVATATACEKAIELSASIAPELAGAMMGDAGRLRQILVNLAGNAVKFTDHGSVRVTVLPVATEGHLVTVRFSVIDTGIGVAAENRHRIFERFTQADSSTARKYGGTGLGLAICKQLVELMGGRIGVDSEPGRGSTFWFEIPLVASRPDVGSGPDGTRDRAASSFRPLRVLLADDNAINQDYVATLLGTAGHAVDVVGDGRQAVEAARKGCYDVVLMDVHMPGIDGIAATKAIRALSGAAGRVPIVALTASALSGDRERYLNAGMTDYVTKPVAVDELAGAMGRSTGCDVSIPEFGVDPGGDGPLAPEAEKAIIEFLETLDDVEDPDETN